MNVNFTQTITIRCKDPEVVLQLLQEWDVQQACADVMGYMGSRMLADREDPERFVLIAEFGVVDPEVSAADEARRNNERPETQAWVARFREIIEGEPEYHDYDELYRTDW